MGIVNLQHNYQAGGKPVQDSNTNRGCPLMETHRAGPLVLEGGLGHHDDGALLHDGLKLVHALVEAAAADLPSLRVQQLKGEQLACTHHPILHPPEASSNFRSNVEVRELRSGRQSKRQRWQEGLPRKVNTEQQHYKENKLMGNSNVGDRMACLDMRTNRVIEHSKVSGVPKCNLRVSICLQGACAKPKVFN